MRCSRLLALALAGIVDVCQSKTILDKKSHVRALTAEWVENMSHILPMDLTPRDNHTPFYSELQFPHHHTAVVTFAGKNNTEYIDGAVMLGMSAQKYLPDYVRVAMIIKGMNQKNRILLRKAGWKLITVPDWESEYCGEGCDEEFFGRWHDSFEKINAFRLPFKRVLFMDSDTYIFKDRVRWLVEKIQLPSVDHIAMAKDGGKDEYNSGVMVFKPDLEVFKAMLLMVTQRRREQILDQTLINDYYKGKIFPIDRMFNCVDTVGIQPGQTKPCEHHCSKNAVIAHFTGHPKPTSPKRRLLELVRRPGAPALACMHTNFGSCGKWSEYYCDIRKHSNRLSTELRNELGSLGTCCHSSMVSRKERRWARKNGKWRDETCLECPATLKLWAPNPNLTMIAGSYMKTTIPTRKFNGGRPIYINRDRDMKNAPLYLFFMQEQLAWAIGANYRSNQVYGFASKEAQCPRDTTLWLFHNGTGFERKKMNIRQGHNWHHAPKDTDHIVWNVHRRKWEREQVFWDHGHLMTADGGNHTLKDGENVTTASAEEEDEEKNVTENDETDAENGTADGVEEDDRNATESEEIDAAENETAESGEEDDNNATEIEGDEAPSAGSAYHVQLAPPAPPLAARTKEDADAAPPARQLPARTEEGVDAAPPAHRLAARTKEELAAAIDKVKAEIAALDAMDSLHAPSLEALKAEKRHYLESLQAAETETTKRGEEQEKAASEFERGGAPSDEELHGIQLVPYVMQSCIQLFKRMMSW